MKNDNYSDKIGTNSDIEEINPYNLFNDKYIDYSINSGIDLYCDPNMYHILNNNDKCFTKFSES